MTSRMSMRVEEDSIVGFSKRVAYYTQDEYDSEGEENDDDFYEQFDPEEDDFDNGDYQPFNEDNFPVLTRKQVVIRPINLSPTKSAEKSPSKSPSWWDKSATIEQSKRVIDGVLNYAALLPPSAPKPVVHPPKKTKKGPKNQDKTRTEHVKGPKSHDKKGPKNNGPQVHEEFEKKTIVKNSEVQKPTRLCLSIVRKTKCFHGAKCRFAHDYSNLKECNFGEKCKKIIRMKTNPDGTIELANRGEVPCTFKHANESKNSYLNRIPKQHSSPRK